MKKTLLIVEDNLILCDILERWLQKAGYRVLTAIDEPSARRKIKGNNVALVLTDVRLPEGDGISLLEWSISQGLHIPFVVMTEHASIADAVRAVKLGAKDYLPKPVHEELLMEDAFLRCSNLTLPFLIHQSPRLSCTRFSPLRVATSENARPVKHAKTNMSLTSSSRGMVNFFFMTACNSS